MNQTRKPPFKLEAAIFPILSAFIPLFGLISPFLDLSDKMKIPITNSRQLFSLGGGLLALISIFYLLNQTNKKQKNETWWLAFLVSAAALVVAVYLWVSDPRDFQKEYRFRDCEYIDAYTDQLDGWEYTGSDTIPTGEILYLDDWSTEKPEKGNAETREQWRYRTRQTTQSSIQPTGNWTLDPNVSPILNVGDWVDDPSMLLGQNVESKNQYRYREVRTRTEQNRYTLGWTTETPMEVEQQYGSSVEISWDEREFLWYYYQYYCHGCGRSERDYDICINCGTIDQIKYYELWDTISYGELYARYGWVELDKNGDIYFANVVPNSSRYREPKKEYRYTIIEDIPFIEYGEWTDWSFNDPGYLGNEVEVASKTVYRVSETIYTYYRWSNWSEWGPSEITQDSDTEVDYRVLYRPYTEETETVYHFFRWNDWSEWSLQEPVKKENREIEFRWVKIMEEQENQTAE